MRYRDTPVRAPENCKTGNTKEAETEATTRTHSQFWWGCKMAQPLPKTVWQFLTRPNDVFP